MSLLYVDMSVSSVFRVQYDPEDQSIYVCEH
jgi:hypothetical protein